MPDTIPFVWSNDDISVGHSEQLKWQLELLDGLGIPGTFFVVPINAKGRLEDDQELLGLIAEARQRGHEFQQHGTRHTAFECGVPETWMLDFSPPTRRQYDENRLVIETGHTLEAQLRMIDEGRRCWRAAFGEDPAGFRPGWGAFCGNLYRALDSLGFDWVSSRIVSPTSWLWNQGQWDAPDDFREAVPWQPQPMDGLTLWELPMTGGDYAFHVPDSPDKIAAMTKLGLHDFQWCRERDLPFVMVSHYHGLARTNNAGLAVHRQLLPRIIETGQARFVTLSTLFEESRKAT